jgi:tetratricopeptide (TPR) repeat protein
MSHPPTGGQQHGRGDGTARKAEDNPQELLRAGVYLLRRNEPREALRILERALKLDPQNPMTRSYLGLSMALSRSGTKQAVQYCEDAVKRGTFHAELYHNLGRVYLLAGDRRRARLAFLEGLKLDQDDPDLTRDLKNLGIRGMPPLSVVRRNHPWNKYLGMALKRLGLR